VRLRIVSPLVVVVHNDNVLSIRAEDASGSFGIMPGHADFLTVLAISVVSWTDVDERRHHCAVRRGVLTVNGGREVTIATREAIPGDDLTTLHDTVLKKFETDLETQREEFVDSTRLQLAAIRQIMRHLRPGAASLPGGAS